MNKFPGMNNSNYKKYLTFILIEMLAILVRKFFFTGHVFSDDAYYSYLSHSLLNGEFTTNFLGYPVFPLRIGFISLNSISMMIFGTNEFSTIIFPFLFSILNIGLTFKLSQLITNDINTSLF
jgi:hypothetical protein